MMYNYGYPGYGYMAGWGLLSGVLSIVFWIIVVIVVVRIIRGSRGGWHHGRCDHDMNNMGHGHSGLNILNERYAKGEINKEEYEQKKKDLLS